MSHRPLPLKDWRKKHPWLTGAILAATGCVATIGMLRLWITTDSGRNFIVSQVNGIDIAGYGELRIDGLTGDPLSDLRIASLQLSNQEGVWAEAENVRLRWSPMALISRKLDISELDIENVSVLSRPTREPRPSSEGGGSWRVHLNSLVLDQLVLADGVAGAQSSSEISARFVQQQNGALDAALRLRPIEGRGDRVDLLIVMTASNRFDVTVIADAPADGMFAHMLSLEPGSAARLEANGGGDLRNAVAEARLSIDREDKAYLSGKMEDGRLSASAKLDASALPLPAQVADFLGNSAEAALAARIDGEEAHFEFDALIAEGEIHAAGLADIKQRELIGPAHISADLASLRPYWENGAGVWLNGQITYTDGKATYSGDTRLVADENSVLPFEAAAGPIDVAFSDNTIPFTGDFELQGPFNIGELPNKAIGPSPVAGIRGSFSIETGMLLLDGAEFRHDSGTARLAGQMNVKDQQISLAGRIEQKIAPLLSGFSGSAEGILSLEGSFSDLVAAANLSLRGLSGPKTLSSVLDGNGSAAAQLEITGRNVLARTIRVRLPGLNAVASGSLAGARALDLNITAEQTADLVVGATQINLGAVQAGVTQPSDNILLRVEGAGGQIVSGPNTLNSLEISAALEQYGSDIEGPIRVAATYQDEKIDLSALLKRTDSTTRIDDIAGKIGRLHAAGHALLGDNGDLDASARLTGREFVVSGVSVGQASADAYATRSGDEPVALTVDAALVNTIISDDLRFDRINATIRTVESGYSFFAKLNDATRNRETDMSVGGSVSLGSGQPEGTLDLDGAILGQTVSTRRDAKWKFGDAPEFDADVSVLGGQVLLSLAPVDARPQFEFELDNVDAGPLLASFGAPVSAARIDGRGAFIPFGATPSGSFSIRTNSPVSGLDGAVELNLDGKLAPRMLSIDGSAKYGPTLGGELALAIPVTSRAGEIVQINRAGALLGRAEIEGNLEAVRQIALAYGHDIGGNIDATLLVAGTPEAPEIDATADISDGLYEYGAMGFRVARFDMNAALQDGDLSVEANGQGPDGGTIKATGRMDNEGQGQVDIELNRLLVYDRNSDSMRLTGNAALTESTTARVISGRMNVDEARFSLDNLPASGARRLDIRWREDITVELEEPVLEKPIRFDFHINSDRRIFIDGRGLTSEWGVNVNVTGSPATPFLNGRATLVRGELELARRPFVFDTGSVNFDGPVEAARVAISADRQLDGLSARVDVTGSPAHPRIELSSTPDLPQDEILSRMLFGRSVMDLSALEAAELASSIARLSGQGPSIDPLGQIQAGLGLDRLRLGMSDEGNTELGVGQYLAPDVYLEVTTAGAAGNSVEVEWQPRPRVSVTSEASSTGESRISVRWKRDY